MLPRCVRVLARQALPLALLAVVPLSAAAQSPFHDPYVFAGPTPHSMELGDTDGDGQSDLFVCGFNPVSLRVLLGQGSGGFTGGYLLVADDVSDFAVADFDGDGRDDLATTDNHSPGLQVRLAIGGGAYGAPLDLRTSGVGRSVRAADLDGDGELDLVVGLEDSLRVSIALGTGDGGFSPAADAFVPNGQDRVETGDIDGDGLVDLVTWSNQIAGAAIEFGLGSAEFAPPLEVFSGFVAGIDVGDLNRDGADDLALLGVNVQLIYGQLGREPRAAVQQPFDLSQSSVLRIADVDGDEHPDLVLCANPLIGANRQLAGGVFGPSSSLALSAGGLQIVDLAFGDIDHDGTLDMVSLAGLSNLVTVHLGQGDGGFRPAYGDVWGPSTVDAADLDRDGRLDLLTNSVGTVLTIRPGQFDASFGPPLEVSVGVDSPRQFDVSDSNGDGQPDLLAYSSGQFTVPAKVSLTPGHGDLSFGTPVETIVHSVATSGDFVDFNADGRMDLVLVGQSGSNLVRLSMMANEGDSFVLDSTLVFPGAGAGPVFAVDLDEDGALDVVVRLGSAGLHWLKGFAGQGFGPPAPLPGLPALSNIELADLTADGHLDLVGLDTSADTLVVVPGHGDATFGAPLLTPVSKHPGVLLIDDLDGDGLLDAAVAFGNPIGSGVTSGVSLYRGLADGSLGLLGSNATTALAHALRFADTNGDGVQDLLLVQDLNVAVLINDDGPWNNLGQPLPGAAGFSEFVGEGTLQPGSPLTVAIQHGPPLSPVLVVLGTSASYLPFKGGTLVPQPLLMIPAGATNAVGTLQVAGAWPASVPPGASLVLQAWFVDPGGPAGFSATNALSGTTP